MKWHNLQPEERGTPRQGFTVLEVTIALGVLATASLLVAELITWSLAERAQLTARAAALELAANTLEAALVCPAEQLTQDWGDRQRVPELMTRRLRGGKLAVQVEPEPQQPGFRRVTVTVRWEAGLPAPVRLTGLLHAPSDSVKGGQP
jgi:type II secretory pathway pseudopilin PulG